MPVGEVVGEDHVRAKLLKAILALGAGAVGVNHTADRGEIAGLELGDCRSHLGDTPDDFVSWDARIDSGHGGPLVTNLV